MHNLNRPLCGTLFVLLLTLVVLSCSVNRRVDSSGKRAVLSQTAKREIPKPMGRDSIKANGANITTIKTDSSVSYITEMELDESGTAISTIKIDEIVVTSTLKSIPERFGYITVDFRVSVPKELEYKRWSIILNPLLRSGDSLMRLDPIVLRGEVVDIYQRRGQWRYDKYSRMSAAVTASRQAGAEQQYSDYVERTKFFSNKYRVSDSTVLRRSQFDPYYGDRERYSERVNLFADKYSNATKVSGRRVRVNPRSRTDFDTRAKFFARKYSADDSMRARRVSDAPRYGFGDSYAQRAQLFATKYNVQPTIETRAEYVMSATDTTFPNKVLRAKSQFMLNPRIGDARLDSVIVSRHDVVYHYKQDIRTNEHTSRLHLTLEPKLENIYADRTVELQSEDTLTYTVSSMISFIDHTPRYIYKVISKYATVNDRSWVSYPLGKYTIIDTLGNNKAELDKMKRLMSSLLYQYEFFVDSIILTAASSPEGTYRHNEHLSMQRARSLRDYLVREFNKDVDTLITVRWIGEDWGQLYQMIKADQNIVNRQPILDIITSTHQIDRRDGLIANRYADDYKYIKNHLYPKLRSVSFKYDLRRVGMVQDTVYTTQIDSAYMQGIDYLVKRKYREALNILDPYKDINSAITLMSLGYDAAAYDIMIDTPQTPERDYMLAVLCARLKRLNQGMEFYKKACAVKPSLEFRGNLDPEVQYLLRNYNKQ